MQTPSPGKPTDAQGGASGVNSAEVHRILDKTLAPRRARAPLVPVSMDHTARRVKLMENSQEPKGSIFEMHSHPNLYVVQLDL